MCNVEIEEKEYIHPTNRIFNFGLSNNRFSVYVLFEYMDLEKNTYIIKESITVTDNTLHRH
jgi:hypothetical protein